MCPAAERGRLLLSAPAESARSSRVGAFTDGKLDTAIADPDLRWDGSQWHLYYQSPHGTTFNPPGPMVIRHATSADLATWTFDETPSLTVPTEAGAWDATHSETPSVAYNPDAPADRRYLFIYSGARNARRLLVPRLRDRRGVLRRRQDVHARAGHRSPKGKAGLVLTGADAYPGAGGAIVADPEVQFVGGTYHLWFSSFACEGTSCATVKAFGIGHATSTDGIHWTVDAAPIPCCSARAPTRRPAVRSRA